MMKGKRILVSVVALGLMLSAVGGLSLAQGPEPQQDLAPEVALGTAFTYQGQLTESGSPATGSYDFQFKLYNALSGGGQVGGTVTKDNVAVSNGLFTVELDFGSGAFAGDARWLQMAVREGSSTGAYTDLSPRQAVTATPYSQFSLNAGLLDSLDSTDFLRTSGGTVSGNLYVTDHLGVGTTSPQQKLHVVGVGRFDVGVGRVEISEPGGWPGMIAYSANGHRREVVFKDDRFSLLTSASANPSADNNGIVIRESGNVGIGTTNPLQKLHVSGWAQFDGNVGIGTTVPTQQLHVAGQSRFDGNVGIGTNNPLQKLHVSGWAQFDVGTGTIEATTPGGYPGFRAYISTGYRRDIQFRPEGISLLTSSGGLPSLSNGITISDQGNLGVGTFAPGTKLDVNGTSRTKVLQITGGSDLAEPFDIAGADEIEPGAVVAIDAAHPGQLRLADRAYDRTVAGCVSGANGVEPGLTMHQEGTVADGAFPVALTGRVYCWATAANGPIEPGDLLTTSDLAGHAMKVTDYDRAQGATIGKAMSTLEEGEGLILVLVTLQ